MANLEMLRYKSWNGLFEDLFGDLQLVLYRNLLQRQ